MTQYDTCNSKTALISKMKKVIQSYVQVDPTAFIFEVSPKLGILLDKSKAGPNIFLEDCTVLDTSLDVIALTSIDLEGSRGILYKLPIDFEEEIQAICCIIVE